MDLKNNNLSGSLPSSMGSLSFLQSLHLRKNNLSGVLPPSLQNCSSLLALDLGENKFEGNIPNWIGERLSRIMILGLCSNDFQGDIPHELCDLGSLTILDPLASGYYGVHVHGSRNRNCGTNFPCLLHHGNIIYIVSWRVSYKVSTRLSRNASEPCFATREIAKGTLSYLPRGMLT